VGSSINCQWEITSFIMALLIRQEKKRGRSDRVLCTRVWRGGSTSGGLETRSINL